MISAGDAKRAMLSLPFAPLQMITHGQPVLILAPHADDESLGCGGLIAASVAAGHPPYVLIATDGSGSHPNSPTFPPARLIATREREARNAVHALGVAPDRLGFLRLPDTAAPTSGAMFQAAVQAIEATCVRVGAGTILAPWEHDPHCDHEAAHLMATAVADRLGLRQWAYPVWGWTLPDGHPIPRPASSGVRLDITAFLGQKQRAVACHASQYGNLITDDPSGFQLPEELLAVFQRPFETFLRLRWGDIALGE